MNSLPGGSCQGRRTEYPGPSYRACQACGLLRLTLAPLLHLLLDVDAVVVEHLLEHGQHAPSAAVLVAVGLKREEEERAVLVQPLAMVVDQRAAVEADQVLHGVECPCALVGVDPRLALGRFVRQFHAQIVERFDGIVELQNSLFVRLPYTVAIRFYP